MRAVIQRVNRAAVSVDGQVVGAIDRPGLLVLVGATHDAAAPVLVVSQFTLYADTRKGRRPSWNQAAGADVAEPLVRAVVEDLRSRGLEVATGQFGAHMVIDMQADGPVTIELEA